jgi:hypothetical protein
MRAVAIVSLWFLAAGCSRIAEAQSGTNAAQCARDLAAIRALRDGPQTCANSGECTVWHNGTYWDGCPREVNNTNAARLDAMRRAYTAHGCRAEENGACAAFSVRGCVNRACGGF